MRSDEAMSHGLRLRKFLSAKVAVEGAKKIGAPARAVTPRLIAAAGTPTQTARSTEGTMTTLATSITTSKRASFSQGVLRGASRRAALEARRGSCGQL